ncbi:MAG: peptidoglycan DD-metalloendopeptidase family protein [Bacteroidetes bacterium]|nr:peptidoglycan DD-metalloendopeptidase family protein [Bacteroidota bacterium]
MFISLSDLSIGPFFIPGIHSSSGYDTASTFKPGIDSVFNSNFNRQFSSIQTIMLIDSILDMDIIPHTLLSQIDTMTKNKNHDRCLLICNQNSGYPYPAHNLYFIWDENNTHPYPDILWKNDTSVNLVLTDSNHQFFMPVRGPVTSGFGYRHGRNHNGVDIDLQVWDTVRSAFDGVVRIADKDGGYGRLVVIRHYNGFETFYAHLQRIKVKSGQKIKAGEMVGLGGKSGRATGSHLHFEVRFRGKPVNPGAFISFKENKLVKDSIVLNRTNWSYAAIPKGVKYYKVKKGDCLYDIASRYGTTIRSLCSANSLSKNSVLRVGQQLRIN